MRILFQLGMLAYVFAMPIGASAQLQISAVNSNQSLFCGAARQIVLLIHNPDTQSAKIKIRARLYETSFSTSAPLGEPRDWKELEVMPGQTILETDSVSLPGVKAATRFLIQYLNENNKVLGLTDLMVYPTNLLASLKSLTEHEPIAVSDPQNQIASSMKNAEVKTDEFSDDFTGPLAIIGAYPIGTAAPEDMAAQIKRLARRGTGIVWIQRESVRTNEITPSFYLVQEGKRAIVVVQASMVSNLADNPQSQLNLLYFAKLAMHPDAFHLSDQAPAQ